MLPLHFSKWFRLTKGNGQSGRGLRFAASLLCGFSLTLGCANASETNSIPPKPFYEIRTDHDPNGIGKFYLGREIADVMGHQAANWLERPERQKEERTDLLIPLLKLNPGEVVADIGAGTGYYSRLLAKAVGSNAPSDKTGWVYAEEIQPEMLDILTNKMAVAGIGNVRPVLGTITDPKLPNGSLNLILMVDVYHEFDHPFEMVDAMCRALKPGGRIVFVEFRGEDPAVDIKRVHKMTEAQVRQEMSVQPLTWVETLNDLPQQHVIIFRKKTMN